MIKGLFINGYKSYGSTEFVSLNKNVDSKFSAILGQNGVGKSAILESIDYYFNDKNYWNKNKNSTLSDTFVTILFKIEKKKFDDFLKDNDSIEDKNLLKSCLIETSRFFSEENMANRFKGVVYSNAIQNFEKELKNEREKERYYYLVLGRNGTGEIDLKPFGKVLDYFLKDKIKNFDRNSFILDLNKFIKEYYTYIYIPVEQKTSDVLSLESIDMQRIMNKDISDNIQKILNERVSRDGKNISVINLLNDRLKSFMLSINENLAESEFEYSKDRKKEKIVTSDLVGLIIQEYFSTKSLKKKNHTKMEQLSSGEQRRAIIEVVTSFLKNRAHNSQLNYGEIIIAIDEPEISQDISNVYSQFERLESLSSKYGYQTFITTHWYGLLPIINNGTLTVVYKNKSTQKNLVQSFDFHNYLDKKEQFPDDIHLKSFYDLTSSLLGYLRNNTEHRLILCEGGTDRKYLESMIEHPDIKILPVGGKDNVKLLFNLFSLPIKNKTIKLHKNNRVLFLIDTDNTADHQDAFNVTNHLYIGRLQVLNKLNRHNSWLEIVDIVNGSSSKYYNETRIEDVLDADVFYETLSYVIDTNEDEKIKEVFGDFEKTNWELSNIKSHSMDEDDLPRKFLKSKGNFHDQEHLISAFIESHKTELASAYSNFYIRKDRDSTYLNPLVTEIERILNMKNILRVKKEVEVSEEISSVTEIFYSNEKYNSFMKKEDGEIYLVKGSEISSEEKSSITKSASQTRKKIIDNEKVAKSDNEAILILEDDIKCKSINHAATIVTGRSTNANEFWRKKES
ncbi:AAA family ATPase [Bacillus bombysepticus]|nr:AAA family ATPase [Bacillus bombysepticus]